MTFAENVGSDTGNEADKKVVMSFSSREAPFFASQSQSICAAVDVGSSVDANDGGKAACHSNNSVRRNDVCGLNGSSRVEMTETFLNAKAMPTCEDETAIFLSGELHAVSLSFADQMKKLR
jgi:hypothetical protein